MSKKVSILLIVIALLTLVLVTAASAEVGVTEGDSGLPVASHRLIVQLDSPSLAEWASSSEISVAANLMVDGRLNVQADAAQAYIRQLEAEQAAFAANVAAAVPGAQPATFVDSAGASEPLTYQVVFNGVVIEVERITPENIKAVAEMQGVKQVLRDYEQKPAMYASIPLIGAPTMWEQLGGQGMSGEGIIIGVIDSGTYAPNPFFDPTGFTYPAGYPVGDTSVTTEKVIGARAYFRFWDPPLATDADTLPGPNSSSHGTHTAGTAAGNADTTATTAGYSETISGVAPRAQVLSYRVFYPSISGSGSAYDAEIVMAYEDAVLDGADVINYSAGGYSGVMPWASATAIARDGAWDAGVFVSHSAGNAGPGSSSTTDASPKVIEVAASSTSGTIASGIFSATAPEPVPEELKDISFATASFGAPLPIGSILGPYPYVTALSVDPANFEGCDPWPAGTFDGVAAMISRGACEFGVKVLNAEQAGAAFVVIYNHAAGGDGLINMGGGAVGDQVTISSIFIGRTNGLNLVDWFDTNGDASRFAIDTTGFQAGNVPDVIASFSSRGPAFASFMEPDVTAPGVNILSAGYGDGTGLDQLMGFGQNSGTSMAAPHVAGSAALLKQMHPDWTPTQIMSALMSTSTTEVWLDAAHTVPATVLDMGAGRIDLTKAGDPGLTFDYPSVSFGSHPAGMIPSMTVMATDVSGVGGTYNLSAMADAGVNVTVDPASLTLAAGETLSFEVMVDTTGADAADYGGFVYLDDGIHMAHLPLWVRVEATADAAVLLVDNDMSDLLGYPDYSTYYADAMTILGWDFDYYNADLHFNNPQTLPSAAELAAYDVIVYWSGDNWQPNGTFTVATPLTEIDMQVLSDWMFNGGRFFASGQDLAAAWDATDGGDGTFLYQSNLGAEYLQDSIFGGGLPPMPSVVGQPGSPFSGLVLDLSGYGDGAANQGWVDEIRHAPFGDTAAPETIAPVFSAIDGYAMDAGNVGMSRAAYPTLEEPVPPYPYRSLYLSYGLEGINDDTGYNTRGDVMAGAMAWLLDGNTVTVHSGLIDVDSIGELYRWDFGDGSPYSEPNASNQAGHQYAAAGTYTVWVEAMNGMGATQLGSMDVEISEDMVGQVQYFTAEMVSTYVAPDPLPEPVTVELPLMADTWVDGGVTGANYNDYAATVVRTTGLDNALLTFDRSALPEGVEVLSAELAMNLTLQSGSFGKELAVLNVEAFDTMTVTYDDAPAVYNPGASVAVPDELGMVTFDVAGNVEAWDVVVAQATADGHLAQLAISGTGTWGRIVWDSLESYEAEPPVLMVTYRPAE